MGKDVDKYIEDHRVTWVLLNDKYPKYNQYACYNRHGEFLYNEDFPKHINPDKTYPCGQHTLIGIVPIEHRDVTYQTSLIEREGFEHES